MPAYTKLKEKTSKAVSEIINRYSFSGDSDMFGVPLIIKKMSRSFFQPQSDDNLSS